MFDFTDSYRPGYAVMAFMVLLALPLILTLESQTRVAAQVRQAARCAGTPHDVCAGPDDAPVRR